MLYALVQIQGKQLILQPGYHYDIDFLAGTPGDKILLKRILLLRLISTIQVGTPIIKDGFLVATILMHFKQAKKTFLYKKQKKHTKRMVSLRPLKTRIYINN